MAITKMSNSGIATGGSTKYDDMLAGNPAYEPSQYYSIASSTGGSATITFSSIPQTYKSLQIRFNGFCGASYAAWIQINGVTTANAYQYHTLEGLRDSGGTTYTYSYGNPGDRIYPANSIGMNNTYPTVGVFDIVDYSSTSKKPVLKGVMGMNTNNTAYNWINLASGVLLTSGAVTSITIGLSGNTFTSNSSVALYGIKG